MYVLTYDVMVATPPQVFEQLVRGGGRPRPLPPPDQTLQTALSQPLVVSLDNLQVGLRDPQLTRQELPVSSDMRILGHFDEGLL